jgi:hypothetical protein
MRLCRVQCEDRCALGSDLSAPTMARAVAVGAPSEDSRASGINNHKFQKDDSTASSGAVSSSHERGALGYSGRMSRP